jgi:hypothetical protein
MGGCVIVDLGLWWRGLRFWLKNEGLGKKAHRLDF